jgi:hypothetical protein
MLLGLASAVILWPESHGIHDHILLFQISDYPNLEDHLHLIFHDVTILLAFDEQ